MTKSDHVVAVFLYSYSSCLAHWLGNLGRKKRKEEKEDILPQITIRRVFSVTV